MNETIVETKDLSKLFRIGTRERMTMFSTLRYKLSGEYPTRDLWALSGINISVKRGEMLAVIGPNGAGKTTLLKILSGIMAPTSGTCMVNGEVSCLFELGLGFNPRFTAIENVYLYGALHGMSRKEVNSILPEIIEFSGLENFIGAKLGEYSSGMRARLAFATIIQTVKGIVMVDELLAVGDMNFQNKCIARFEKLLSEGNTLILITHSMPRNMPYCTNTLYLKGGKQIAFGDTNKVIDLYESENK